MSTALAALEATPAPDTETLTCEVCGQQVTGKLAGPGSATWKMGTHRRVKHGIAGQGRKGRRKKGAPTEAQLDAHPVLGAMQEAASEIGVGKKGAPSSDELAAGLGRLLTIATMGTATLAAETDPAIPRGDEGQKQRDIVIDLLTLDEQSAKSAMVPFARAAAGTRLNKRYGRAVVDNVDVLGALFDLGLLLKNWNDYLQMRRELTAELRRRAESAPRLSMAPAPTETAAAAAPSPSPQNGARPPGFPTTPMQGYVVSADDIQRQRRAAS